jgi:hypothetical protein
VLPGELFDIDTAGPRKTERGLRGCSIGSKGRLEAWTPPDRILIGLPRRDPPGDERQSSWCRERLNLIESDALNR